MEIYCVFHTENRRQGDCRLPGGGKMPTECGKTSGIGTKKNSPDEMLFAGTFFRRNGLR